MFEGTIASLTPTVCRLLRITAPTLAGEPYLAPVNERALATLGDNAVQRCLIYCPDALGDHLWSRFSDEAAAVAEHWPQRIRLSSVVPAKTPVCFASVFTGASPERHGIRKPERPVLACDTLFDALLRAGRRVAISAVRGSSIDLIFRNRAIDYFSEDYDKEVTDRALAVLAADSHDVVVVYHQEYDDQLHQTEPFSVPCLQAFRNHVGSVQRLARAAEAAWSGHDYAIIVATDHGAHADPESGVGNHGLEIPEDMCVSHWYGLYPSAPEAGRERKDCSARNVGGLRAVSLALLTTAGGCAIRNPDTQARLTDGGPSPSQVQAPSLGLPPDVDPDQTVTFYDDGAYREATLSEIAGLVSEAAADPRAMLGPEWYRSPGYAARYFTLDLLGIADWRNDAWSQCASGPGNAIQDEAGVNLGIYLGPLGPDDEAETTTVTLNTAEKTAYLITLARAWPGGPWLVVNVEPAEYVEGP